MATHVPAGPIALRPVSDRGLPDGARWPENRRSGDELGRLPSFSPPEEGRIARVFHPPPDRHDSPHSVGVFPGRVVEAEEELGRARGLGHASDHGGRNL